MMREHSSRTVILGAALLAAQFFGVFLPSCGSTASSRAEMTSGPDRPASAPLAMVEAMPFLDPNLTGATPLEREETRGEGGPIFVSRFEVAEGDSEGSTLVVERSNAGEGRWRLRTFLEAPAGKSAAEGQRRLMQEEMVGISEVGGATLLESINHAEGVVVRMTPEMTLLPETLSASEPFTQKSRMTLPLISNPARLREQGTVEKSMFVAGLQRIEAGRKAFECVRVHETHSSNLSMARSERSTDSWYAPGVGLVARRYSEEVKVLGLTVRSRSQTVVVRLP